MAEARARLRVAGISMDAESSELLNMDSGHRPPYRGGKNGRGRIKHRASTVGRSWRDQNNDIKCCGDGSDPCFALGQYRCIAGHAQGQCLNRLRPVHLFSCSSCWASPVCVRHREHSSHRSWADKQRSISEAVEVYAMEAGDSDRGAGGE